MVSGRHAPAVRDVLRRLYGDRYLTLPHARRCVCSTRGPSCMLTHDTLIDPRTKASFNALAPGDLSMAAVAPTAVLNGPAPAGPLTSVLGAAGGLC